MNAKEQAVTDIKEDLEKQGKSFIAFHSELDSIMRKLVSNKIREQESISYPFNIISGERTELVAHCTFCNGTVVFTNYNKYYENK